MHGKPSQQLGPSAGTLGLVCSTAHLLQIRYDAAASLTCACHPLLEYRCCATWLHGPGCCRSEGGLDAERTERKRIKEEKEEYDRRNFEAMLEIRRQGFRRVSSLHVCGATAAHVCQRGVLAQVSAVNCRSQSAAVEVNATAD